MSENFLVEIISPDNLIIESEATEVTIPSYEGQMGILKDHIPLITFLRPGLIIITKNNEPINFTIEINDNFSKRFSLKNINELKENSIFIDTDKILLKDKIVYIKFIIDNPVTKLELLESPDARKLGLLVESIELINN